MVYASYPLNNKTNGINMMNLNNGKNNQYVLPQTNSPPPPNPSSLSGGHYSSKVAKRKKTKGHNSNHHYSQHHNNNSTTAVNTNNTYRHETTRDRNNTHRPYYKNDPYTSMNPEDFSPTVGWLSNALNQVVQYIEESGTETCRYYQKQTADIVENAIRNVERKNMWRSWLVNIIFIVFIVSFIILINIILKHIKMYESLNSKLENIVRQAKSISNNPS